MLNLPQDREIIHIKYLQRCATYVKLILRPINRLFENRNHSTIACNIVFQIKYVNKLMTIVLFYYLSNKYVGTKRLINCKKNYFMFLGKMSHYFLFFWSNCLSKSCFSFSLWFIGGRQGTFFEIWRLRLFAKPLFEICGLRMSENLSWDNFLWSIIQNWNAKYIVITAKSIQLLKFYKNMVALIICKVNYSSKLCLYRWFDMYNTSIFFFRNYNNLIIL